jgi:hypothetical protein
MLVLDEGLHRRPMGARGKSIVRYLTRHVQEAWHAIPLEFLQKLLNSMPALCAAVVAANRVHTKY